MESHTQLVWLLGDLQVCTMTQALDLTLLHGHLVVEERQVLVVVSVRGVVSVSVRSLTPLACFGSGCNCIH